MYTTCIAINRCTGKLKNNKPKFKDLNTYGYGHTITTLDTFLSSRKTRAIYFLNYMIQMEM